MRPYLVWISLQATPMAKRVSVHAIVAAAAAAARLSVRQILKWCAPAKVEAIPTMLATNTNNRKICVAVLPENITKARKSQSTQKQSQLSLHSKTLPFQTNIKKQQSPRPHIVHKPPPTITESQKPQQQPLRKRCTKHSNTSVLQVESTVRPAQYQPQSVGSLTSHSKEMQTTSSRWTQLHKSKKQSQPLSRKPPVDCTLFTTLFQLVQARKTTVHHHACLLPMTNVHPKLSPPPQPRTYTITVEKNHHDVNLPKPKPPSKPLLSSDPAIAAEMT